MAMAVPLRKAITATSHTVMTLNQARPASRKARIIMADCVTSSSLRLSTRSAITPPKSVKRRNGMEPAKPTTPSQKAELVSTSTSQPWATFCIQVPMLERKLPLQKRRKFGLRRARTTMGRRLASSRASSAAASRPTAERLLVGLLSRTQKRFPPGP